MTTMSILTYHWSVDEVRSLRVARSYQKQSPSMIVDDVVIVIVRPPSEQFEPLRKKQDYGTVMRV